MSTGTSTGTLSKPIRTLYLLGYYVYWETIYWDTIYCVLGHYMSIGTLSIMGHTCTFWGIKGKSIGTISAGTQDLITFLLYWETIY